MVQWPRALDLWEASERHALQSPFGLLENKALTLLGLGRREEALTTLRQGLAVRIPGDVIDLDLYDLLARAPRPPAGLDEFVALLRQTDGEGAGDAPGTGDSQG